MYKCYVAIGDSLTEGYGDEVEGFEKSPWPNLVSKNLGITEFYNFGKSGYRSDEILLDLFPKALALHPDLVTITAGGNDMIQCKWNKSKFEKRMLEMIQTFHEAGATVVTCSLPDFTTYVKAPWYKKLIAKYWILQCNQTLHKIASQYPILHIDFTNHPCVFDKSNWSQDLIHPNAKGYYEIARAYTDFILNHEQ